MRKCLIVDSSSVVRKIARRILEGMDFSVVEADDALKALDVCKRGLPDAILFDWNVSAMDGSDFLMHLRSMPGGDTPKVLFCSTENGIDHIARALETGADEYIVKPFVKEIVATKFQEIGLFSAAESGSI